MSYTDEGDPIVQDVTFDGDTITAKTDSTRDEFGAGIVTTITCKAIDSKVEAVPEKREEFFLTGCKPDDHDRSTTSPLLTVY